MKLERQVSDVLGSKNIEKPGLKLLEKFQWESNLNSDWTHRLVRIAQEEIFVNLAVFRNALLTTHYVQESVQQFIPDIKLEETFIPCSNS